MDHTKKQTLPGLLFRAARLWNDRAVKVIHERGGAGLRVAHATLLPYLSVEGVSQSELASSIGVSKQAIGPLIADLEKAGVVKRVKNPTDARSHLVVLTAQGTRATQKTQGVLDEIEAKLTKELGPKLVRELTQALGRMIDAAIDDGG